MSSRFAISTQILVFVGSQPDRTHRSEDLAAWVGTNPAFVRRLLQMLTKSGLVETKMGKGGGAMLARAPERISLADIYNAVEDGPLLAMPRSRLDEATDVGRVLGGMVRSTIDDAEDAFVASLEKRSIADLLVAVADNC